MPKTTWQVWTEPEGTAELVQFEGTKAASHAFYKRHGGTRAGLHIGYVIPDDEPETTPSPLPPDKESQS